MTTGLSIRETARIFSVSRPTLAKWISTGKVSAAKADNGEWLINPSEMIRLGISGRPQAKPQVDNLPRPMTAKLSTVAGQEVAGFSTVAGQIADNSGQEIETLKARLAEAEQRAAVAEARAAERIDRIDDLGRRLDRAEARADLLLTDQRTQQTAPGSWWRWFKT